MIAAVQALPLSVFAVVVAITLTITWWVSRRQRTASEYLAAGRSISGLQNGLAIAGEYVSASTFLGVTGLIFLFGFDGVIYLVGALSAFLLLLFVLAERLRNVGEYTMADVLAFRLRRRPVRAVAAVSTLVIVCGYVLAQLLGGALLFETLVGIDFAPAVIFTAALMLIYVFFGGMRATTWVQVIKASLLLVFGALLTLLVLIEVGFDLPGMFSDAAAGADDTASYLGPGGLFTRPADAISVVVAYALGTAAMPHVLMRFFTVTDSQQARRSAQWALVLIGGFFLMVVVLGFGAAAILSKGEAGAIGTAGNMTAPVLAESLGGGAESTGGDILLAVIAAVTFATILAVVTGLVMSASGAVAHDLWANVVRRGDASDAETLRVARLTAVAVAIAGAGFTIAAGKGFNITFLVALVFAIAASANLPALVMSLAWRRFNTAGAVTGMIFGLVASVVLIGLSPPIWPGADSEGAPFALSNPAIVSVPIGFVGCLLGTLLSRRSEGERSFAELEVRSQTGIGALR
jgi:cation/acetate symporter